MRWRVCAVAALMLLGGCGVLEEPPRAATPTPVRLAVARVATSSPPTPTVGRTPTRAQGWAAVAPLAGGGLGFILRRYDASGAQDPDHGDWLIDVIEAE